jgi:hypothetical protein
MGADIHIFVEQLNHKTHKWEYYDMPHFTSDEGLKTTRPFDWRNYFMFGMLGGVRNNEVIGFDTNRGFPDDLSDDVALENQQWDNDGHSHNYIALEELLDFDYDANPFGYDSSRMTFRHYLPDIYFINLEELKQLGNPKDVRILFFFDN